MEDWNSKGGNPYNTDAVFASRRGEGKLLLVRLHGQDVTDRNIIFDLVDTEFSTGRFGFKSEIDSILIVNEVEMFEHPLETDLIVPGFSG